MTLLSPPEFTNIGTIERSGTSGAPVCIHADRTLYAARQIARPGMIQELGVRLAFRTWARCFDTSPPVILQFQCPQWPLCRSNPRAHQRVAICPLCLSRYVPVPLCPSAVMSHRRTEVNVIASAGATPDASCQQPATECRPEIKFPSPHRSTHSGRYIPAQPTAAVRSI